MDKKFSVEKCVWEQMKTNLNKSVDFFDSNIQIRDCINDIQGGEEELGNSLSHYLPDNQLINFKMFKEAWKKRIEHRKKLNFEQKKNY